MPLTATDRLTTTQSLVFFGLLLKRTKLQEAVVKPGVNAGNIEQFFKQAILDMGFSSAIANGLLELNDPLSLTAQNLPAGSPPVRLNIRSMLEKMLMSQNLMRFLNEELYVDAYTPCDASMNEIKDLLDRA